MVLSTEPKKQTHTIFFRWRDKQKTRTINNSKELENEERMPIIYNLSNKNLGETQIELLKKGLKFTPTPNSNINELKADIDSFCRKI